MRYRVQISRNAEKHMLKIARSDQKRIRERITALRDDPYSGAAKLASMPGFRQRVGNYRVIFEINTVDRIVLVTGVFHRGKAHR